MLQTLPMRGELAYLVLGLGMAAVETILAVATT
jgi:hypothetical protein